ncbi:MAG: carboxymuconolactone decarboxylase family protein [Thermocrispum sp.]
MRMLTRFWSHLRVLARAKRNRTDLLRWLGRRPQLLAAVSAYEFALLAANRTPSHYKQLASAKAAALVNCEFCLDIGSALSLADGIDERKLLDLPRYRDSDAYDAVERLVIEFAEEMSKTPALVRAELRERLLGHFTRGQLAEIAAEVAWEHQRARLNQALGVRPAGFTDGAVCLMPERP